MSRPPEKILIVDDEKRLLSGLRRNLGSRFHILTAESGAEALEVLASTPEIAVVLTDMQMPSMNGVELLKSIQKLAPAVRRLMLTGNADQETAISAVNEGAVLRFLRKPCDPEVIDEALNFALEDFRFTNDTTSAEDRSGQVARESFISTMSHELRTPLNHIIGLSQLIKIPDAQEFEQSREFLNTLRVSADHLLHTLVRMLDYARLTSAEAIMDEVSTFDLVTIVSDAIYTERHKAKLRDITIGLDTVHREVKTKGIAENFAIAVREILDNAVKFSERGGHVSITIKVSTEKVDIRISDCGVGIEEDALGRIFGSLTQADETSAREYGGIGLGLSIASAALDSGGGTLSLTSERGRGTSAVISLPIMTEVSFTQDSSLIVS